MNRSSRLGEISINSTTPGLPQNPVCQNHPTFWSLTVPATRKSPTPLWILKYEIFQWCKFLVLWIVSCTGHNSYQYYKSESTRLVSFYGLSFVQMPFFCESQSQRKDPSSKQGPRSDATFLPHHLPVSSKCLVQIPDVWLFLVYFPTCRWPSLVKRKVMCFVSEYHIRATGEVLFQRSDLRLCGRHPHCPESLPESGSLFHKGMWCGWCSLTSYPSFY